MTVQRAALVAIAVALLGAELVRPTQWSPKKLTHALASAESASGIDSNVLESLPPIDKQALGSIDFIQFSSGGNVVNVSPHTPIPHSATIVFIGWCGDPDIVAIGSGAFLSVDGRQRIDVSRFLGGDRPDVVKYYSSAGLERSGFRITIDASAIGSGTHEIQFGVIAHDRRGYFVLGGPIDLTVLQRSL